jgi:TonB-linked SusC/RagA family outer membrane protein
MKNDEMRVLLPKCNLLHIAKFLLIGFFLLTRLSAFAQQKSISGTVTGEDKVPLPGVTVLVKGTNVGTLTDGNGKYTLSIPANANTLVFSFVGMQTREIQLGAGNVYDAVISESSLGLEEIVVVGYGTQKKISVTGAIVSIGTADLVKSPTAAITNSLAGRVTGLTTVQYSGQPGADDPNVYVRGIGSLSASASTPLMLVDGVERSFTQIDPNEIESISVLKDASATAVYGIRGANGVIIVTTKRGSEGTPKISFTSSAGLQMPTGLAEMCDSYTWAKKYTEAQLSDNPSATLVFSPYAMKAFKYNLQPLIYSSVDWINLLVKPSAFQTQENFNITGGSSVVKYFVSLGYLSQNGLLNTFETNYSYNFGYKRYNYRANIDVDMTKSTKFSLTIGGTSGLTQSPSGWASTSWPTLWRSDPFSGQLFEGKRILVGTRYISFANNKDGLDAIRWGTGYARALSNVMNLDLGVTQKLDFITKGLNWRFTVSNNSTSGQTKTRSTSKATYDPWFICDVDPANHLGDSTVVLKKSGADGLLGYSESSSKARNWYLETALAYDHQFGDHNVTALLLYNESKSFYPGSYADIPTGYVGLAARTTYNYKMKYLVDINLGYNGSENFAPANRFGLFPSIAVGWALSEEYFLKDKLSFLNYLKLRFSYGIVGNDRIGGNRFLYNPNSYSINTQGYSFGTTIETSSLGAAESTVGNPGVTWEKSRKSNLGIDLGLFKGKLSATADVFYEYRNNIITTRSTVPSVLSLTLPAVNIGRVENRGFEVEVKWRSNFGKFNYYVSSNVSFAKNKILFMDEIPKNQDYLVQTGRSTGTRWGYVFDGFWTAADTAHYRDFPDASYTPKPGDTRFKDIDGNGVINSDDQKVMGYPDYPEYIFSLSGGADYRGFDMSFLFNATTHVSRVLSDTWMIPFQEIGQWALMKWIADNSWTPETANTAILPRITLTGKNNNYKTSDLYIRDASYIRLKNIEIGYSFTAGVLKRLGISKMRIFANGYNLLTFTKLKIKGMDPESQTSGGRQYPLIKIANAGINVTF